MGCEARMQGSLQTQDRLLFEASALLALEIVIDLQRQVDVVEEVAPPMVHYQGP